MRTKSIWFLLCLIILSTSFTSCRRNRDEVWDDTKTCGRHMKRGFRSLGGKHGNSRIVCDKNAFYPCADGSFAMVESDFIPMPDVQYSNDVAMADYVTPQATYTPGDPGSSIPGIDSFRDPSTDSRLASVYRTIRFEYNSSLVKGDNNLQTLRNIADHMKQNPNTYVFIEGHCDERGPEAFNLSLGSRRANSIRNLLVGDGVNPDNLFTISYGKERPSIYEHHEEAWAQNRRAEFKVYQR